MIRGATKSGKNPPNEEVPAPAPDCSKKSSTSLPGLNPIGEPPTSEDPSRSSRGVYVPPVVLSRALLPVLMISMRAAPSTLAIGLPAASKANGLAGNPTDPPATGLRNSFFPDTVASIGTEAPLPVT